MKSPRIYAKVTAGEIIVVGVAYAIFMLLAILADRQVLFLNLSGAPADSVSKLVLHLLISAYFAACGVFMVVVRTVTLRGANWGSKLASIGWVAILSGSYLAIDFVVIYSHPALGETMAIGEIALIALTQAVVIWIANRTQAPRQGM